MDESILTSVKQLLGLEEDYTHFDTDIIIHVNSALAILHQLGIGPETCTQISDKTTKWSAVLGSFTNIDLAKTYVYIRTKQIFDPPQTGPLAEALKKQQEEYEWRLSVAISPEVEIV